MAKDKKGLSKLLGLKTVKSDEDLMLAVGKGDRSSFQKLYEKFKGPIMNYVFQMTKHQALSEEISQEVFLKVYRARETYSPDAKFTTWLWTIARNTALDHVRKKSEIYIEDSGLEPGAGIEKLESPLMDAESGLIQRAEKERVEGCLEELGENQKEALLLRTFSELSYDEIANQIGLSLPAVKSLLHRAKESLLNCLGRGHHE